MSDASRFLKGRSGEDAAADFLVRCGMKVMDRNFRCPGGEIDIIAREGKTVVFVEVRTRGKVGPVSPEESISAGKRKKIIRAARWYLKKSGLESAPARIDVVAITWNGDEPAINWIPNAFDAR